tara:strand:- start:7336 stop:7602 length:267 start_codon:yes stop_codon:yes gene_type:complete
MTHYLIIENGDEIMDGEFMSVDTVRRALEFADRDARVFAVDMAEAWRDGRAAFVDVTDEIVTAAILGLDLDENMPDRIGLGPRRVRAA